MDHDGVRCRSLLARVSGRREVSDGLLIIDMQLPESLPFLPGQFAMLNFTDSRRLVFGRPFSILASAHATISFLFRVVGRGTGLLAEARPGDEISLLGPLGHPFAAPKPGTPAVLIAGGVGLPPLLAWQKHHARPEDQFFFGGRDGGDVPWGLLDDSWCVSVDRAGRIPAGRQAVTALVVDHCRDSVAATENPPHQVLACGPNAMLRAAARLAAERRWPCQVSLEEHMGCGYGVCRGCIVPLREGGQATACRQGPVFDAQRIDWARFTPD